MKFAVLKTGGKQYLVKEGDKLKVEKIKGDFSVGSDIVFNDVLMTTSEDKVNLGKPTTGTTIKAKVVSIGKADKILVQHYMPKSRWAKRNGHRQPYFEIEIVSI